MSQRAFRWLYVAAGLAAAAGVGGYFFVRERGSGGPPLTPAPVSSATAGLVVGKPVHVSKANETIPHQECVAAADPSKPGRLLVAAIYSSDKWGKTEVPGGTVPTRGIAGYYSEDGGASWQIAFEHKGDPANSFIDPALAFGPDGSAHFVCMRLNIKAGENRDAASLEFTKSPDGGKTWGAAAELPPHIDRPWIAVDSTKGPYRGRLYCLANFAKTWDFFAFPDADLATALKKVSFPKNVGLDIGFRQSSNLAVLSDGAVVLAHDERSTDKKRRPVTKVYISRDGGQTFQEVGRVNTTWTDSRLITIGRLFFPQLAADTLGTTYRDRLYYVWEDGGEQGRILLSASGDRGRTWTAPLVLSEQPTDGARQEDYNAYKPCIAVNKEGVVAVSWYDRRGLAAGTSGYNVRLRVSFDGGASWLTSVQLNGKTCQKSPGYGDDTAGLAADADGDFHPAWIDDRTGKSQVWTATVRLEQ